MMTQGLDGSFRYPKTAYLAAIGAQVCYRSLGGQVAVLRDQSPVASTLVSPAFLNLKIRRPRPSLTAAR